jgi:hypothetical protein
MRVARARPDADQGTAIVTGEPEPFDPRVLVVSMMSQASVRFE